MKVVRLDNLDDGQGIFGDGTDEDDDINDVCDLACPDTGNRFETGVKDRDKFGAGGCTELVGMFNMGRCREGFNICVIDGMGGLVGALFADWRVSLCETSIVGWRQNDRNIDENSEYFFFVGYMNSKSVFINATCNINPNVLWGLGGQELTWQGG